MRMVALLSKVLMAPKLLSGGECRLKENAKTLTAGMSTFCFMY